ncbi:MAG: protein tyrosine phosphatase family protein [Sphingomonas sp.]|nr:protein tyrosine phosphatase family protein [Sphingomonas sp.]
MSDPDDIRNFLRLDDRITTSGRLLPGDPARLAAIGVRHVINLALDSHAEALPDEAAVIAKAGLRYTHIPIPFDAPTEDHYRAFRAAIEADDTPVHVHCIMNWRVSALFYRYNRDEAGMAEPDARALMERIWNPANSDYPGAAAWADLISHKSKGEDA